jgi:hypothetical protein
MGNVRLEKAAMGLRRDGPLSGANNIGSRSPDIGGEHVCPMVAEPVNDTGCTRSTAGIVKSPEQGHQFSIAPIPAAIQNLRVKLTIDTLGIAFEPAVNLTPVQ